MPYQEKVNMFHLNFNPPVSTIKLSHENDIVFMGSCFSEHISQRLLELKFNVNSNAFGIVFNPISISTLLLNSIKLTSFNEKHFIEREGSWFHLDSHSQLHATTKSELNTLLNNLNLELHAKLKTAQWLFLTFGSAYVYEYVPSKSIVANCNKLPHTNFVKRLLTVNEIVESYSELVKELKSINPNLQVVFTVSPVKHLRDGIVENNLSKSVLIQSVHELVNNHSNCNYFPVYELVTDDLRDYRFFEADMAHPNKQSVNYVFDKFAMTYFSEETQKINKDIIDINSALNHRPFNENSASHKTFKNAMLLKCKSLVNIYPFLNLKKEILFFGK